MILQPSTNAYHAAEIGENDALVFRYEKVTKPSGEEVMKRYIQGRLLGRGSFAKVYQFTCPETRETFAAKVISKIFLKDELNMQKVKAEIKLHKKLTHPNIVKFHHSFEDQENLYILMELCDDSLFGLLKKKKRFSESEAKEYILQIIQALKHLHEQKVLHRDLKLANLLLNSKMQLKMADFGLAAKLSTGSEKRKTSCGTPNFMAPEVMHPDKSYSYPADIWSFGVICYNMLVGRLPFEATTSKEVYNKVQEGKWSFPPTIALSLEAKDLISKIIISEPEKRMTLLQIQMHPFLFVKGESSPKISLPMGALETFSNMSKNSNDSDRSPKLSTLFHKVDSITNTENKILRHKSADPSKAIAKTINQMKMSKKVAQEQDIRKMLINNHRSETAIGSARTPQTQKKIVRENSIQIQLQLQLQPDQDQEDIVKGISSDISPTHKISELLKNSETRLVIPDAKALVKSLAGTPHYKAEFPSPPLFKKRDEKKPIMRPGSAIDRKIPEKEEVRTNDIRTSTEWPAAKVLNWLDFPSGSTLGYVLSDGRVGIIFNDETKMLLSQNGESLFYIVKALGHKETYTKYGLQQFPGALKGKVTELLKVDKYFERERQKPTCNFEENDEIVYVRKWLKTKHGTFFKLSTQELQVILIDKSCLLLDSEEKHLKYINQQNEVKMYNIGTEELNQDKDVKKRFIYAMEVLERIWKINNEEER